MSCTPPRTLGFLESLGFQDIEGDDLDNYLSLNARFTSSDIGRMKNGPLQGDDLRTNVLNRISEQSLVSITNVLNEGQTLLNSLRSVDTDLYGTPESPLQFDELMETAYLNLQDGTMTDEDIAQMVYDFEAEAGISPEQLSEYVGQRLAIDEERARFELPGLGGAPATPDALLNFLTPDKIRQRLS